MKGEVRAHIISFEGVPMAHDPWPTTRLSLLLKLQVTDTNNAWDEFVARYRPAMVRLVRDACRLQESEAEDIAQEVLVKLVKGMSTFSYDPNRKFRSWLRTVTRNALRDVMRKENRRLAGGTGDTRIKRILEEQAERTDALAEAVTLEMHRDILAGAEEIVSRRVEDRTWEAYVASREGTAGKEIAAKTGMSLAAVYKAKSKVIHMIRMEISENIAQH